MNALKLIAVAASWLVAVVSAAAQSGPGFKYDQPAGFYRLASDSPVEFDAYDGDVRIRIFPFQPLRDDVVAHFQRNLFANFLPPRDRETQLLMQGWEAPTGSCQDSIRAPRNASSPIFWAELAAEHG